MFFSSRAARQANVISGKLVNLHQFHCVISLFVYSTITEYVSSRWLCCWIFPFGRSDVESCYGGKLSLWLWRVSFNQLPAADVGHSFLRPQNRFCHTCINFGQNHHQNHQKLPEIIVVSRLTRNDLQIMDRKILELNEIRWFSSATTAKASNRHIYELDFSLSLRHCLI